MRTPKLLGSPLAHHVLPRPGPIGAEGVGVQECRAAELAVDLSKDPCPSEAFGRAATSMFLVTVAVGARDGMVKIMKA